MIIIFLLLYKRYREEFDERIKNIRIKMYKHISKKIKALKQQKEIEEFEDDIEDYN